jgi:hypothetical protein
MSYITFDRLSTSADFGSQLQQYASMYAVAKETNKTIVLPESTLYTGWGLRFAEFLDIEDVYIVNDSDLEGFENITQQDGLLVDERVFGLDPEKNYNFSGLFHLYHYWYPKYKEEVVNFKIRETYLKDATERYKALSDKETVSIHIRRGDYLNHDVFCKLDAEYYLSAMNKFDTDNVRFVVFSNDIQWCKDNLPRTKDIVFLDRGQTDYSDLVLMSLCDHNIIANSSFSLWAAIFNKNKNKLVVCPKNYIKTKYKDLSFINGNYYPEEWLSINNKA